LLSSSEHSINLPDQQNCFAFLNKNTIASTMSIVTNNDYSSIDATSILLMKLMREQQSRSASQELVNSEDSQTQAMFPPSTSTPFTGVIGDWLKDAKFNEKHGASLLVGGGLRNASTMQQQSRQRKLGGFPLAARKKRSLVKAHSMRMFRALWSNGASRDQHVNREVFARKLERGTLVVKTRE
jgi:hypothetical protein